ncbi:MAG: hypothetical protein BJ554DRAFT_5052, partial [Olpidium bornovanus]
MQGHQKHWATLSEPGLTQDCSLNAAVLERRLENNYEMPRGHIRDGDCEKDAGGWQQMGESRSLAGKPFQDLEIRPG